MNRQTGVYKAIQLGSLITRLRQRADELEVELASMLKTQEEAPYNEDEELISEEPLSSDFPDSPRSSTHTVRRPTFPEGTPLNRKIMEFLRKQTTPCSYQDVREEVPAHHQSIQNALRDLEGKGFVTRLGPNQWMALENATGASGNHRR